MFDPRELEVVIGTADGVRLGAYESILRLSSSVLGDMLLDARAAAPQHPPVLEIPEHSSVILPLLELCYPIARPSYDNDNIRELLALIETARKYKMRAATQALEKALLHLAAQTPRSSPGSDALSAYFAGCCLGMREVATTAASCALRMNITKALVEGAESFGVPAGHLWRLLEFQRRCRAAVRAVVEDAQLEWMSEDWKTKLKGRTPKCSAPMPCWWEPYRAAIAKEPRPTSATARSESVLKEAVRPQWRPGGLPPLCSHCFKPDVLLLLFSVSQYVASTMDEREREVALPEWPSAVAQDSSV